MSIDKISPTGMENMLVSKEMLTDEKKEQWKTEGFLFCERCGTENFSTDYWLCRITDNGLPDSKLYCADCMSWMGRL